MASAAGTELVVIPGMEITTAEEAHIIGLFEDVEEALSMQAIVYRHLFSGENDPDLFGLQVVANEYDEAEAINTRLLIGGTVLTLMKWSTAFTNTVVWLLRHTSIDGVSV
ncbi:MAG: hypothetical protein U5R49_23835 [Deltaproteobacteria bacterium]|nr:hypothetical protein [Deltaproteobacteria bacterium]